MILLQKIAEFDTTITGPWMRQWEIVHVNQHTRKLDADENSGQTPL